jgi:hypothetical protein
LAGESLFNSTEFRRSNEMNKAIITIMTVVLVVGVCNVRAEIIWDSGHHEFSEGSEDFVYMYNDASADISGGIIHEFYMYNNTTADITGGYVSVVLGQDTSSVASISFKELP